MNSHGHSVAKSQHKRSGKAVRKRELTQFPKKRSAALASPDSSQSDHWAEFVHSGFDGLGEEVLRNSEDATHAFQHGYPSRQQPGDIKILWSCPPRAHRQRRLLAHLCDLRARACADARRLEDFEDQDDTQ